ncbi:MAG: TlpA disulfide reductase family protein [Nevskia sp.]|nr:TlpA disulfide reductase family protein [Nevskia sp.]
MPRLLSRLPATLVLALLAGAARAHGIEAGAPAPPLQARLLDGGRFVLAEHRGEVVVLNFWATWCVPCRAELPAFADYYRRHRGEGLSVVAVSMDDPELLTRVREVAATLPFPTAMYADAGAEAYGRIWRLPITFVIDRRAALRVDGGRGAATSYDLPALERTLDPLLAEPVPESVGAGSR